MLIVQASSLETYIAEREGSPSDQHGTTAIRRELLHKLDLLSCSFPGWQKQGCGAEN